MSAYMRVFNLLNSSPAAISAILKNLGVWHGLVQKSTGLKIHKIKGTIDQKLQPLNVVVLSSLDSLNRLEPVVPTLVLSSFPKSLVECVEGCIENLDTDPSNLEERIRYALWEALKPGEVRVRFKKKLPHEHIESVSPPSFLDKYQTIQCKINPYSLRQQAHKMAVGYIAGSVAKREAERLFNSSLKFNPMKELVMGPEGAKLRDAIAQVSSGMPIEDVTESTGIDQFEITYMMKSYKKLYGIR